MSLATIDGMTDLDEPTVRALVRAMPKAELHLHLDGSLRIDTALEHRPHPRHRRARRRSPACAASSSAPEQSTDQAELLKGLRPADRADAGRRRDRANLRRPRRGQGARQSPLRRGPLGAAPPRPEGSDRPTGGRGHGRGRPAGGACRGDRRQPDRDPDALASARGEPRVRPRPRGERRAGRARRGRPRRTRGALPRPDDPRARPSTSPARSASMSRRTPANGAARRRFGGRSRSTRSGSRTVRWRSRIPTSSPS